MEFPYNVHQAPAQERVTLPIARLHRMLQLGPSMLALAVLIQQLLFVQDFQILPANMELVLKPT